MKKTLSVLLAVLLVFSLIATSAAAYADEDSYAGKTVVLYTGNIRGDVDVYAKIAEVKATYEAKGAEVLLVDAGNYLQGAAAANSDRGLGVYNLMDAAGYDVAAMGMYEFVYGDATTGYVYHGNFYRYYTQAELFKGAEELTYNKNSAGDVQATRAAKAPAGFDVLSSNVGGLEDYYAFNESASITTASGLKVGFLAVTDTNTVDNLQDSFFDGLVFSSVGAVAVPLANQLKQTNDVVVCLSNAGASTSAGDIKIEIATNGALSAGAYVIDNATKAVTQETVDLSAAVADGEIAAQADALKAAASVVVGKSTAILNGADSANWNGETNLGNLTADALKWYAENHIDGLRTDAEIVAIQNGGNCDQFIYPGDITETDLLKALPFSPMGVGVIYLTGEELLETLEAATQTTDCPGWAQVSGIVYKVDMTYEYDAGEAYGKFFKADSINRVTITSINGKAFDKNAAYGVVADNFLINGNDTYYIFKDVKGDGTDASKYINNGNGVKVRDIVALYIANVLGGTIGSGYADTQNRITVIPPIDFPFVDVVATDWFYGDVKYVYANGLMNGTDNTHFSPNTNTSRGMIVTILWRLEGEPEAQGGSFTDVPSGAYYAKAVAWAAANNIVTGYSTTTFGPEDDITREQFASILYRYAVYKDYDITGQDDLRGFTDSGSISSYAQAGVRWAVAEGIVKGDGNAINPAGKALRSAAAAFLHRFCVDVVG